ncbi:MAG: hypothetical protein HY026_03285 [Deltaproteobacteria bacterium]|nr:hypothetical protein [Deltaproteobacteria bacterium]
MKKTSLIFLFIVSSLYPLISNAVEQASEEENETIEVTADGVGTIKGDAADARRSAIDDGLRIAVEQAKGVFVKAETAVESYAAVKDEIATKCKGYVKTYKILNENKDDKASLYRVRLQAAVLLSDPKESAPVVFDEQKFEDKIPDVIKEAIAISKKTNAVAEMIGTKRTAELNPEMLKKLRQRYLIMIQMLNSIEPPRGRVEKHRMLKKAIALKARATRLYGEYVFGKGRSESLKSANTLNKEANAILRDLKERAPQKTSGLKQRPPHRPQMR